MSSTEGRIKFLLGEFDSALLDLDRAVNSNTEGLASTLLDRAMVKCALTRYREAMEDINTAVEINPNRNDIKRFQECLEDILCILDTSKSSTPLLQPTQPVLHLLTGDYYERNWGIERLDKPHWSEVMELSEDLASEPNGSLLRKRLKDLASMPDYWTEVREPSKDLTELDLEQGTSHNLDHLMWILDFPLWFQELYGMMACDSLRIGKKLAEGGQAEIFEAIGTTPLSTQTDLVLKVFQQTFPLQTWLQPGVLQFGGDCLYHPSPFLCTALGVKFLEDGRCAFVFPRHWGDLRRLIDQRGTIPSPFEFSTRVKIVLQIAQGMRFLHNCNIVHRDLKASNILVNGDNLAREDFLCKVTGFECSVGVMGTGFWRAPEILTQLNHRTSESKALAWSKAADVYSFGMNCYEIITGCSPFGDLRPYLDYDVVLSGGRPQLPPFLNSKLRTLIELCWHADPKQRPRFSKICKVLADMKGFACNGA